MFLIILLSMKHILLISNNHIFQGSLSPQTIIFGYDKINFSLPNIPSNQTQLISISST